MGVLDGRKPEKVWEFFEEICEIPHGSGNEDKISDYLVGFANERGLKSYQDESKNVIIWCDGSKGYEKSEPVIIQGHIDMVAVKEDGVEKDLTKEGVEPEIIDDDILTAKGTTLGADDGIAVAYVLALMDSDDISHPPIEAVFTTNEETGMFGAMALDKSKLSGKTLLNIDSEDEGRFVVSCTGGATTTCILPGNTEPISGEVLEIRIDGLTGGHSGTSIIKERLNANVALGRILLNVFQEVGMRIVAVNGGEKENSIAAWSEAAIVLLPETLPKAKKIVEDVFEEIKKEYATTDPDMKLKTNVIPENLVEALTDASTLATIISMVNMPDGIQRMNPEVKGLVQTSLNMGILRTEAEGVKMSFMVRSSNANEKQFLIEKLTSLTEIFGGVVNTDADCPGWEYQEDSEIRKLMVEKYKEQYGEEPTVEGIHAGLECGIFVDALPGLDAIAFGPQIDYAHTPKEQIDIKSAERTWKLLCSVLEEMK